MIISLPVIPVPAYLPYYYEGDNTRILPWIIQGSGIAHTYIQGTVYTPPFGNIHNFYDYHDGPIGYTGVIPVPLFGDSITVTRFRLTVYVENEAVVDATLFANKYTNAGPYPEEQQLANIVINASNGAGLHDIWQQVNNIAVSASSHNLGIRLNGRGQGLAVVKGLAIDVNFNLASFSETPIPPSGLKVQ